MADRRRRTLILALGVLALGAVAVSARAAPPSATTVTAVRAHVSYVKSGDVYRSLRLRITRKGRTWRSGVLGTTYLNRPSLTVRDLDADGEPEVVLDTYSGGAHCCLDSRIFRHLPGQGAYAQTRHRWGNVGYRPRNLDGRDGVELVTADDRFAYEFTAFAASFFPLRIWRFDGGRLVDVTRLFPGQIEHDAAGLWRAYRGLRPPAEDVRGVLAAWIADQCLLGRERQGWAVLEAAYRRGELGPAPELAGWAQGRSYLRALRTYLRTLGYAR